MGVTLETLHNLQGIERKLATIRAKADAKRRQIRIHQRAYEKQDAAVEHKKAIILNNQLEIDRIELNVKTADETLTKHREALNQAKTNKEYAAILTALNTEKADNTKLESRQLQLMTELDAARNDTDAVIAEREVIAKRVEAAKNDLQEDIDASAAEVEQLQAERAAAAENVIATVLATFERVAERHEGVAMAEVSLVNAKRSEYACGGCNMSLTLDLVLSLHSRDDIQLCGSCGMILYLDPSDAPRGK